MTGTPRSIIGPHTILSFTNLPTNKHNDSKKYDFILIYFEATILTSGDFVRVLIIIPEGIWRTFRSKGRGAVAVPCI